MSGSGAHLYGERDIQRETVKFVSTNLEYVPRVEENTL